MYTKIALVFMSSMVCGSLSASSSSKNKSSSWWGNKNGKKQTKSSSSPFERGDDPLPDTAPHGYNTPAQVHLKHKVQGFFTASFLYWEAQEDGLELATTAVYLENPNEVVRTGLNGSMISQNFEYESGFKAGIGLNFNQYDHWTLRADYTRFHQATTKEAVAESLYEETGAIYLTDWYFQVSNSSQSPACSYLRSRWDLGLDWLDFTASRGFYQGKRITATPFAGVRCSWMSQSLDMYMKGVLNLSPFNEQSFSNNKIDSWGVGPRMGIEGSFLLGLGFRVQGMMGGSLLFTKYDTISHYEDSLSESGESIMYNMDGYTALRPMLEANLGIGWGTYFCKQKGHIDFSATYDFNYLWSQNMMRTLSDLNVFGASGGVGDLSLQGLTVSTTIHF